MEIYVMRHSTTVWNESGIIQGHSKNRLSTEGKKKAEKIANEIKDLPIDLIITSPLTRTIQTANIINEYHKVKIVKDRRIIEIDEGIFTGKRYSDLTNQELYYKRMKDSTFKMESYFDVYLRIKDFLKYLKENYYDKKILVVTHNICAATIEYIKDNEFYDEEKLKKVKSFQNCEIRKIKIAD